MNILNLSPSELAYEIGEKEVSRKQVSGLWLSTDGRGVIRDVLENKDRPHTIHREYFVRGNVHTKHRGRYVATEKALEDYLAGCFSINKNLTKQEIDEYKTLIRLMMLSPTVGCQLIFLKRASRLKNVTKDIFDDETTVRLIPSVWEKSIYAQGYTHSLMLLSKKEVIAPPDANRIMSFLNPYPSDSVWNNYYTSVISYFLANALWSKAQDKNLKHVSAHLVGELAHADPSRFIMVDYYVSYILEMFFPLTESIIEKIIYLDFDVVSDMYSMVKHIPSLRRITDKITALGVDGRMPLPSTAFEIELDLLD